MKTEKLSLSSIKNVLSRAEMRKIMAGSGDGGGACGDSCSGSCTQGGACKGYSGTCGWGNHDQTCYCTGGC